ncbi:MAG: serine hydrolase [Rhodobacteraceae bacterium]|nr:serine hydrolase [Paracoccaceae bacterium]
MPARLLTAAILSSALAAAVPLHAQTADPRATLEAIAGGRAEEAAQFAPGFLQQIAAEDVAEITADLRAKWGALEEVISRKDRFILRFQRADVPTDIVLDDDGRVAGLWFHPPQPRGNLQSLAAAITGLPGQVSLLVVTDGEVMFEHEADKPLPVASAAKLAVLAALQDAIASGRIGWPDVVTLRPEWRSLPSGRLQDWPEGSAVTVETLANLMISESDNTATDALIALVGRDAVEAKAPRNRPFLTTRELFILKSRGNRILRAEWRAGDEAARQGIVERLADDPLPEVEAIGTAPTPEVEWYFTARELCAVLGATEGSPSLGINPGVAERADWNTVAFKGGSEPGVVNLSTLATDHDGRQHCVVATWVAGEVVDEDLLFTPYRGLLGLLARGPN